MKRIIILAFLAYAALGCAGSPCDFLPAANEDLAIEALQELRALGYTRLEVHGYLLSQVGPWNLYGASPYEVADCVGYLVEEAY